MENNSSPNNGAKHDYFFKVGMANLKVAREFLQMHLPSKLQTIIDLDQIKVEKDSFVDSNLKSQLADVLISCKGRDGKDVLVYALCEHQSKPDYWMSMRLFKYIIAICEHYKKSHPKATKLPLVYPIVFYNGRQQYNVPLNFYALFEHQEIAKEILQAPYKVVEASKLDPEELKQYSWAGVMQFFMQRIWYNTLLKDLEEMSLQLKSIGVSHEGIELLRAILCYNENRINKEQELDLLNILSHITNEKETREIMGTLAQSYREEGLQQGLEQGREQAKYHLAKNLIKLGVDSQIIANATGLDLMKIAQLKEEIS